MKIRIPMFCAAAAVLTLSGCRSCPPPEDYAKISAELERLNSQLAELNKNVGEFTAVVNSRLENPAPGRRMPGHARRRPVDVRALDKITLPENPTDAQIRKYMSDIRAASAGQSNFSSSDPQVEKLAAIGPGHLPLILETLAKGRDGENWHLEYALPQLVDADDKEIVLKNLQRHPALLSALEKNGWAPDAKEQILRILESSDNPWLAMNMVGKLELTAEERARVIELYQVRSNMSQLLAAIREFPDADLPAITEKGWENHRYSQRWEQSNYARSAAEYGSVKALGGLIDLLVRGNGSDGFDGNIGEAILQLTGQPCNPETLPAWFEENKGRLTFDRERKRFVVAPPAPAAPSVSVAPPAPAAP